MTGHAPRVRPEGFKNSCRTPVWTDRVEGHSHRLGLGRWPSRGGDHVCL